MFKRIVEAIAAIETKTDYSKCWFMIDNAFQRNGLSWHDYETLYSLLRKINYSHLKEG